MKFPRRAIFFGRFQPFHKGHLYVAENILKEYEEIVFLVGMSTESHTERNPFTAGERIEMIRLAMKEAGFDLSRVITSALPTLEIHIASAHHAIYASPHSEAIFIGNPIVSQILREAGFNVIVPKPYKREIYNGTLIRRYMAEQNDKWRELVPKNVAEFLDSIKATERLKNITSPSERHILGEENSLD
ncbi:nicotinamide-nucleotide adenylyltransferase [Fervidicoccus fontis]|uniref:Nicotinamide-nucleotide adenylyltransferase n=1 Tax=Fervidicoccus fontis TaxID=683846 RepID=A0A7C2VAB1_9CREN|nr:nicotinamide-nucleotide adenylyltransferase [Fervidicoccus fontis]HEW63606.1 nicotinamide-nucleotide adenylyltransferase [Fervidicoccus fontis]